MALEVEDSKGAEERWQGKSMTSLSSCSSALQYRAVQDLLIHAFSLLNYSWRLDALSRISRAWRKAVEDGSALPIIRAIS